MSALRIRRQTARRAAAATRRATGHAEPDLDDGVPLDSAERCVHL